MDLSEHNKELFNTHIGKQEALSTPQALRDALPIDDLSATTVVKARKEVRDIIWGKDKRLLAIVGPCSIHDIDQALEYARLLQKLSKEVENEIKIVMRVYFEKPRTVLGWKGMIYDPHLDDSFDILTGLQRARKLLLEVNKMGLACATEMLDPLVPQYIADLVSWTAIGARTTESQTHRQMASGLSMPVGFKNSTNGDFTVAINAAKAARKQQSFLGINQEQGQICIFHTNGNPDTHLILRGGNDGPNYSAEHVAMAEVVLEKAGLEKAIMIDCNHSNSGKDPYKQPEVLEDIVKQKLDGNKSVIGFMVESHIHGGSQNIPSDLSKLKHGVSITDACIDFEGTKTMFFDAQKQLTKVLLKA
ncbi:MAG: 3-deoxy-7-phosphoheptulonate synthase [Candidatus Caenarcaniphilales bacterium]|jgi:3-deoxy-7-phosphoheptulonate synthase|nr:3-deoxy-7-phosphoheptulonate synthase [Candidatus Caenarcaniphilales bacterium]